MQKDNVAAQELALVKNTVKSTVINNSEN